MSKLNFKLASNLSYKLVSNFFTMFFGMAISSLIVKKYGLDEYANLVNIFILSGAIGAIYHFGIRDTIMRYIPIWEYEKNTRRIKQVIISSIIIIFFSLILLATATYISRDFINSYFFNSKFDISYLFYGLCFCVSFYFLDFLFIVFQSLQDWKFESFINCLYYVIYFVLILFLIFVFKVGLKYVFLMNAIASFSVIFFSLFRLNSKYSLLDLKFYNLGSLKEDIKLFISFGSPLLISGITFYFYGWIDKIVISTKFLKADLSEYYLAFKFYIILYSLIKVGYSIFNPYYAHLSKLSFEVTKNKYEQLVKLFFYVSIVLSIAGYFFIVPAVDILYGYNENIILFFRLQLISVILLSIANPQGIFMVNVLGFKYWSMIFSTALTILQFVVIISVVEKYQIKGVIYSMIFVNGFSFLSQLFIKEFRDIFPYRFVILKAVPIFTVFAFLCFYLESESLINNTLFGLLSVLMVCTVIIIIERKSFVKYKDEILKLGWFSARA